MAIFPTIITSKVNFGGGLLGYLGNLNRTGNYREFVYMIVIIAVVSISALCDFIVRHLQRVGATGALLTALAILFFGLAIVVGYTIFIEYPVGFPLSQPMFLGSLILLAMTVIVGLATEICTALPNRPISWIAAGAG